MIADVIANVVNERLYGLPCTTCKISEHFISLYPLCEKVSSWVEPVCDVESLTEELTCTSAIAVANDPICSPTITVVS